MGQGLLEVLRGYLAQYGYWAVALALLLENAGVPVPGETVLLLASFLAFSERDLHLPWIVVVGTLAATCGDNLGYLVGRRGGRPLLERWRRVFRIRPRHLAHGEELFRRHGPVTVFFARFVFGMRVIAGPLAGVLHMRWRRFALFNALGAVTWVTAISLVGYFFGSQWSKLVRIFKDVDYALLALVVMLLSLWWLRRKRRAERAS